MNGGHQGFARKGLVMSKTPANFEQFSNNLDDNYPDDLRRELTSKTPEFWGSETLNIMGHKKRPILKTIRSKCLDCCYNQPKEVRFCQQIDCSLWPYRMGTDPFRKGRENNDA